MPNRSHSPLHDDNPHQPVLKHRRDQPRPYDARIDSIERDQETRGRTFDRKEVVPRGEVRQSGRGGVRAEDVALCECARDEVEWGEGS